MKTIFLHTFSWINEAMNITGKNSNILEKKIENGTTFLTLFDDLARDYPQFRQKVYNPETGQFTDQVLLIVNQRLARFDQIRTSLLNDQDEISLVPVFIGG